MMLENIFFASKQREVDTIVYCIDDRKKSFHVSNNLKEKFSAIFLDIDDRIVHISIDI